MLDAWPADARAIAAAAFLAALPGLLVVRSPWRAMPHLSLAFWALSWTWLGGASRTRLLHFLLAAFGALAVLRLLRLPPWPRPGRAHLLLAAVALAVCLPLASRPALPGPRMPVEALTAELLSWRDGWPMSFEPLVPLAPVRAGAEAALAADVILLGDVRPHRAVVFVSALAALVLVLALWSLASRWETPTGAAIVVAIAMVAAVGHTGGPGTLATAFAVQAVVLGYDRRGHPSAFAAGVCGVAALAADVTTGLLALALAAAGVRVASLTAIRAEHPSPDRLRTAALTAAVLALPLALRAPLVVPVDPAPLLSLAVVIALCARAPARAVWWRRAVLGAAATAAALILNVGRPPELAAGDLAAMEWVRVHTRPLDVVCAPDVPAARWIPAIAARPTNVPVWPRWPVSSAPCAVWLSLSGTSPAGRPTRAPVFVTDTATVWTTSQTR